MKQQQTNNNQLVPVTSNNNTQIFKYSEDYIQKRIAQEKKTHSREAQKTYYYRKALTLEEYDQMINDHDEKLLSLPTEINPKYEQKLNEANEEYQQLQEQLKQFDDARVESLLDELNEINKECEKLSGQIDKLEQAQYPAPDKIQKKQAQYPDPDKIQKKRDKLEQILSDSAAKNAEYYELKQQKEQLLNEK